MLEQPVVNTTTFEEGLSQFDAVTQAAAPLPAGSSGVHNLTLERTAGMWEATMTLPDRHGFTRPVQGTGLTPQAALEAISNAIIAKLRELQEEAARSALDASARFTRAVKAKE